MLVLARHSGESLILLLPDGKEIKVSVVETRWDKVRLGVEAAPDIQVVREELLPAWEGRKCGKGGRECGGENR
jgi:carbon storage regulator CsrA